MSDARIRSAGSPQAAGTQETVSALFIVAAGAGSACLFLVELVAGKLLLPVCGGAPAVWITCLAFFQIVLVAAYFHANHRIRRHSEWAQTAIQAVLFVTAAIASLVALRAEAVVSPAAAWPVGVRALLILTAAIGPAFFALATLTPLFGHWRGRWSISAADRSRESYALYAAGNIGSFAVLLAYPLLIEPAIGVRRQLMLIAMLYAFVGITAIVCGGLTARRQPRRPGSMAGLQGGRGGVGWSAWGRWALLAAVPSSWLAGVTTYATTEVAPLPLLWVVPLAAYLASFALVFSPGGRRWARFEPAAIVCAAGIAAWLVAGNVTHPTWPVMLVHVAALFVVAVGLHGMLVDTRPSIEEQSSFYLALAVGGACGGLFNAVVAPLMFDAHHEFPLAMAIAAGLAPVGSGRHHGWRHAAAVAGLAAFCVAVAGSPAVSALDRPVWLAGLGGFVAVTGVMLAGVWRTAAILALLAATFVATERADGVVHRTRTFFGVLRVCDVANGPSRTLVHGGITHGVQLVSDDRERRRVPLAYYAEAGPLGSIFRGVESARSLRRVAVAGLGIGTVATYAKPGQEFVFFEIDPEVARIARHPGWFSFLADCRGDTRVVVDDARLALAREPEASFDLLVIDAFTGDSVPTHLLTREALALYGRTLTPNGAVALLVSNKYLDLVGVVERLAADGGWMALVGRDTDVPAEFARSPSQWMVLSRSLDLIKAIYTQPTSDRWRWQPCADEPVGRPWTDDHTAVADALRL